MAFAQWIISVWFLVRDLFEHGLDERVDTGVLLDQLFELDQNGVQLLGILVDVVNNSA